MLSIELRNLTSLQAIRSEYALNDYNITDLSIGNDENIYILFANSGHRCDGKDYKAVVLQLEWQTGQLIHSRLIEFGMLEADVDFIQPINEGYLLLYSRAKYYGNNTFDKNALIVDETGQIKSKMCLGDGIAQCFVDSKNRIITSYYDEGVLGNYGWTHPIGSSGLIVWSSNGDKLWENTKFDIIDCYAINLGQSDELWFYYYTKFCLVRTNYINETEYSPQIASASGFLFNKKFTSILFLNGVINGDYKHRGCYIMDIIGNTLKDRKECRFIDSDNEEIDIVKYGLRKSKAVFFDRYNNIYSVDLK